jgi:Rrf2 family protein
MAHLTTSVEYGLHCLLWLADSGESALSSRDLAELQGISPSFLAKIFVRLEKAGIVKASEGVHGGYRLARPADAITILEVVDALEGAKPLFDCLEIRGNCALFGNRPPSWATNGVCAIHAVMIKAETAMRQSLAEHTLADVAATVARKAPAGFSQQLHDWTGRRLAGRSAPRRKREAEAHAGGDSLSGRPARRTTNRSKK